MIHYLSVVVKPHAKVTAWTWAYTDLVWNAVYTCSLKAPAQDGEANATLIALVGDTLQLPKSFIRIVQGHRGRHKVLAIETSAESLDFSLLQS
jgi:uncharacterized protein YggU (UPF0235/DUF167 family)